VVREGVGAGERNEPSLEKKKMSNIFVVVELFNGTQGKREKKRG
jgi:hypothetical protein